MSAPVASTFQDHYYVLGVEPQADSETLQGAYARFAQKYGEDSEDFDEKKLEQVKRAFEALSDPVMRREFDKLMGIAQEETNPKFSGAAFFREFGRQAGLRSAVLCILYDRRRTKLFKATISLRQIEGMLETTEEELNFALWYLKQRNFVTSDDKSSLQITVEGMDFLEANQPTMETVARLIKPDCMVIQNEPTRAAEVGESVRKMLARKRPTPA